MAVAHRNALVDRCRVVGACVLFAIGLGGRPGGVPVSAQDRLAAEPRHMAGTGPDHAPVPLDAADGHAPQDDPDGILDLDIEQLASTEVVVPSMDVEVTSVAKHESTVGRSPAAIFVITGEMIRRSGANSIPEALRMAPGLQVARIESSAWAISSRGFNDRFANKLLVLIDGRTVYSPEFSGVFWDTQDVLLEDVDRIEVIRGPGGTLWGANAVNGVINIITKSAEDTQGALVTYGGGSEDLALGGVRYGGNNGRGLYWRIYGKHFERDTGYLADGPHDDWRMGRGGFRIDWEPERASCNHLTIQGDHYDGTAGHDVTIPIRTAPFTERVIHDDVLSGTNVLARWTHTFDEESDWTLQTYFDRVRRDQRLVFEKVDTFDVDFQHRFALGCRHQMIWGLGYRRVSDDLPTDGFSMWFDPEKRTTQLFSAFVQDEIALVEDRLALTIGSKFERNDFTGFEWQPSARLLWTPDRKHSAWVAISRAVRTPNRVNDDQRMTLWVYQPNPSWPLMITRLMGNRDLESEELIAYEVGYRAQVSEQFAFDVATFYNAYERLVGYELGEPFSEGADLVFPMDYANNVRGETYGVELLAQWTLSERLRLAATYTFLQIEIDTPNPFGGMPTEEGTSPHNQASFRAYWDLCCCWKLDAALRYVDVLPVLGVPSYLAADVRLAWVPSDQFELAVVGQNLLDSHHPEFASGGPVGRGTEVERSVFAKATWRY